MTDEQSKDDGNTFQTGPDIVTPSDAPTPRTDAAETYRDGTWACVDANFARQLERELAAEREARERVEKQFGTCSECGFVAWKNRDKTTEECQFCLMKQRAEQAEARLAEAIEALRLLRDHQNGCPLPSYQKQWTKAMRQAEHILSSTEPPALLKEVEELRKLVHQLQGVLFSDRNYWALKAKLNIAREAWNTMCEFWDTLLDWETWLSEVLTDFKIPFDKHKHGMRHALTQWMRDEREAREKAEGVSKQIQEQLLITHQRAEQAEAKLNIAREHLVKIRFAPVCHEPFGTVLSLQEIAQEALDKIK